MHWTRLWSAKTTLAIPLLLAAVAWLGSTPAYGQCRTYTVDADFDLGTLDGVNHNPPNNDQLQLNPTVTTFPFAWIANADEGTVSKVNTATGKEVARYRTGPQGAGDSPSRTAVDRDGNCWVANRAFGLQPSITQILIDGGIDRNGNGTIETSEDTNNDGIIQPGERLPWGADERVARHYLVAIPNAVARALTLDKAGFVWVGLFNQQRVVKFDPNLSTVTYAPSAGAAPPELVSIPTSTTYGLATSPNGRLYLATLTSLVQEIDPGAASLGTDPPRVLQSVNHSGQNYGIAVDRAGIVWLADVSTNRCIRWDPALGPAGISFGGGAAGRGRGITVDFDGNVWMACDLVNRVVKYAPTIPPTLLLNAAAACNGPIGVSTAADGAIIAVGQISNSWGKIDQVTGGTIVTGGPQLTGLGPYTYSDFTGSLSRIIGREGFWTVVQDGTLNGAEWGRVSWTSFEPANTSTTVQARAADTEAGLASATYIDVSNGVDFSILGRFIQVRARLQSERDDLESPVLFDLTICTANVSPVCDAGGPYIVECQGPRTAVQLNGTGSSDADGDSLTFAWSTDCPGGSLDNAASPTPILTLDTSCACAESCQVNLVVSDGRESSRCFAKVRVQDTTPPVFSHETDPIALWPPNHSYWSIDVAQCLRGVRDACDTTVSLADVQVASVSSDEPEDALGTGDGSTLDDIVIVCPNTVQLRAEREGAGNGRVYTIVYVATDAAGNRATTSCKVSVPHDQAGLAAVEGPGPGYTENACVAARVVERGIAPGTIRVSRDTRGYIGVAFALDRSGPARLEVYDVRGRLVRRDAAELGPGVHVLQWRGKDNGGNDVASGIYVLRLTAGGATNTAKTVWVR